jgi:GT2 family glycosyltransferase
MSLQEEVSREHIVAVVNLPDRVDPAALTELESCVGSLLLNGEPKGYGANLNHGVGRLRGRVGAYLCLNDDIMVGARAVESLAATLRDHPDAGIVGPHGPFRFPSISSEVALAAILPARLKSRVLDRFTIDRRGAEGAAVDWVLGAALLIRAEAFDAVRGFDEDYFFYSEEVDIAYRLREQGWRSYLCADAVVEHEGGSEAVTRWRREALGRGRGRFIARHWTSGRRTALRLALGVTYAWNVAYIGARVVAAPRRASEKLDLLAITWEARTRL